MLRITGKKALSGAFFLWLTAPISLADNRCLLPSASEATQVATVSDGDTVRLVDQRRVRLLAIGTPEIDREQQQRSEPLGLEAKKRLQWLLPKKSPVTLRHDKEKYDRYGRSLAQVISADGRDVAAELLRDGLAYVYIFPGNDALHECYRRIEQFARQQRKGLWALSAFQNRPVRDIPAGETGYQLFNGRVSHLAKRGQRLTLTLDDRVTVKIHDLDSDAYRSFRLPRVGESVTVRGRLRWQQGRGLIDVRHRQGFDS